MMFEDTGCADIQAHGSEELDADGAAVARAGDPLGMGVGGTGERHLADLAAARLHGGAAIAYHARGQLAGDEAKVCASSANQGDLASEGTGRQCAGNDHAETRRKAWKVAGCLRFLGSGLVPHGLQEWYTTAGCGRKWMKRKPLTGRKQRDREGAIKRNTETWIYCTARSYQSKPAVLNSKVRFPSW